MFELSERDVFRLVEMFGSSDVTFMHVKVNDVEVILSRAEGAAARHSGAGVRSATTSTSERHEAPSGGDVQPAPVARPTSNVDAPAPPDVATESPDADLHTITATSLGTFYSASRPDQPPFVEVGTRVDPESTVCLLEAMKVFTAVSAGVHGSIVDVLVQNGELVEYGQPLFRVRVTDAAQAVDGRAAR